MSPPRDRLRHRSIGVLLVAALAIAGCAAQTGAQPVGSGLEGSGTGAPFLTGVNLGVTVPGHFPGELAISRDDVRRWLPQIHALGVDVVRIYTILPPHFYEELSEFNERHRDDPLRLVQGVWLPEAEAAAADDLIADEVTRTMRDEITDAVAVISGAADLPPLAGKASGRYRADVREWVAAWLIGVELDPYLVLATDQANAARPSFSGDWFEAVPEASATESFYAEMLDHLAAELVAADAVSPLAFVNWATTDPLDHPGEPLPSEDLVGIDANRVEPTAAWAGGYYASYHAYPYYPDFLRYEAAGPDEDPYAAYLRALRRHHADLPVLITEFGVPSSIGSAHLGPLGRDQGGHDEREQMAINADLLETIAASGADGGFIFEWTDEWFKATWNTIDLEVPVERRALWTSPWTNEAHFGLLAVEPGLDRKVVLDGSLDEWDDGATDDALLWVDHDAEHLYVALDLAGLDVDDRLGLAFDVVPGGIDRLDGSTVPVPDADRAVVIDADGARLLVAEDHDPLRRHGVEAPGGAWRLQHLLVNRELTDPFTGAVLEPEIFDVGTLVHGTTDPSDPAFVSTATWYRSGQVIELRLPFAGLGFSDPSSSTAFVIGDDGVVSTVEVEQIGVTVVAGDRRIASTDHAWETWNRVDWSERPKADLDVFVAAVERVKAG